MTHLFRQLQRRQERGQAIRVGVIGAGFMGKGVVYQLSRMAGMWPAVVVNRTIEKAVDAYRAAGLSAGDIVVSDNPKVLAEAVFRRRAAVTSSVEAGASIPAVDVIVEATGHVELGANAALQCIWQQKHFVSMNAEADATVGPLLKRKADAAGVVYTNGDGDQPGVMMRLIEYCRACGFEVRAAVNCKGFMNVRATPDSIMEWAIKQNTSPRMTAAFTDGTKMNIENNVLANASGLVPGKRGMTGVTTDLKNALKHFQASGAMEGGEGIVDYTLGGDFGGGVFVVARAEHPEMVGPYLKYLKMGDGPDYLFFRPYHLCHVEVPLSAAEAVIYGEATIAPMGKPVAHTVTIAKRDLRAGETLDGIGGFAVYGQIDRAENCAGLLPVGLADEVRLVEDVAMDGAVGVEDVELNESRLIVRLWREQQRMADEPAVAAQRDRTLVERWDQALTLPSPGVPGEGKRVAAGFNVPGKVHQH